MTVEYVARLLIVDDEAAHVQALCDTLPESKYETVGVTNGREALAQMHQSSFDLLLTDLMMPEMDGISLLRQALEYDPHLVCIIMTGEGTISSAVEAMKTGAFDYILKPCRLKEVLPALYRALVVRQLRLDKVALEHNLERRTSELEAANVELTDFAHSVSHDFRAPLGAIRGYTKILIDDYSAQLPPEAQVSLQHVSSSAAQLGQLMEGILRLSSVSLAELHIKSVSTSNLVVEVLSDMRRSSPERRIEVIVDDLPEVSGDPVLIKTVFSALLSNAFKFTSQRYNPVVKLGCRSTETENVFFVEDNGVGFDMGGADDVFTIFRRLHTDGAIKGTGTGLSIVQRIVLRHGGRIWAESAPDNGATFYFTLAPNFGSPRLPSPAN